MLRILHTGDIHLDSPFSKLDLRLAELRRQELRRTFAAVMQYAEMEKVDLLLIAGDLFDHSFVTRETLALLSRELGKLSCPVVIAPGNHDWYGEKSPWTRAALPENVHVFSSENLSRFSFDALECDVYGYAFTGPEMTSCPLRGARVADDTRIHVALCHGDLGVEDSVYAPLRKEDILAFGADFTALGHIHNPPDPVLTEDARRGYGYCGCLLGRGPDERGAKGALLIEIDGEAGQRRVSVEKIRFSERRYETDELSLTGVSTQTEAEERIAALIREKNYATDTLLTLRLTGYTDAAFLLGAETLEKRDFGLFSLTLRDETMPEAGGGLEADPTVRGEFYRLLAAEDDPEKKEVATLALRYGLAALSGGSVTDF